MTNRLQHSRSPYLLQHANNPVDWFPWGKEALDKAKSENKLIIISIGYSSCHWCHVMERESFEDNEVASLMNQNFVNIKVDREERPDIDHIYMNAATLINGQGGWPLNAIALPNGQAVFAGTYFPKRNWMHTLNFFAKMYQTEPEKLLKQANEVSKSLKEIDFLTPPTEPTNLHSEILETQWSKWKNHIDELYGGRQGAPKFMMPNTYDYLMRYAYSSKRAEVKSYIENSLDKIALGGINDTVSGGFYRYSVDQRWHIPHFEKMLYDNAQLLSVYAQAFRWFKNDLYQDTIYQTFDWLQKEMKAQDGGYYSALDADSEGIEGKYYVWTLNELKQILGKDLQPFADYYQCKDYGNWENGNNHLHSDILLENYCKIHHLNLEETKAQFVKCRKLLHQNRSKRVRPGLDDKRITGWNALLLSGFVQSYWATKDEAFLNAAKELAEFFNNKLKKEDHLWHTFNKGEAYQEAYLSDYAPAIQAFIHLYQATFDETYLSQAKAWTEFVIDNFYDEQSHLFYLTGHHAEQLVHRPKEFSDNVISSSNSIFARCLWQIGMYYDREDLNDLALKMVQIMLKDITQNGPFYAEWTTLLWEIIHPHYEIVVTGNQASTKVSSLFAKEYLPQVLPIGSLLSNSDIPLLENKTEPNIYVCRNRTCSAPTQNIGDILNKIRQL